MGLVQAVEADGRMYGVHTSFKYWLRFLEVLADKNTPPDTFDFMYSTDDKPPSRIHGIMALIAFCSPASVLPRTEKERGGGKAVDYEVDADYIYAAFMEQYGIDLVESDMHWYKFQALFKGLHGTKLNDIIGWRLWESSGARRDAYTRQMERLRAAWELPEESDEEDEALAEFEAKLR